MSTSQRPTEVQSPIHIAPSLPGTAKDVILKALELEGSNPKIDEDGDIVFKHNRFHFLLIFSQADPEYIRLLLPNFYEVENEKQRTAAFAAANDANAICKAAKVYVSSNQTHAAIEGFLAASEQIVPVLMRCLDALEHSVNTYNVARAIREQSI